MRVIVCANCRQSFEDRWRKRPKCCSRRCSIEFKYKPAKKDPNLCRTVGCGKKKVTWAGFCKSHHRAVSHQLHYVRGRRITSKEEVLEVIRLYETQFMIQCRIAEVMGVGESAVRTALQAHSLEKTRGVRTQELVAH